MAGKVWYVEKHRSKKKKESVRKSRRKEKGEEGIFCYDENLRVHTHS